MSNDRPRIRPPRTAFDHLLELIAGAGIVWMIGTLVLSWPTLPDRVPSHFGISGSPDAWSSRWTLLILPAIGTVLYSGLTLLSRFPYLYNYPWPVTDGNAERQYRIAQRILCIIKAEIIWFFGYVKLKAIQVAHGTSDGIGSGFLPTFLLVTFGTVAGYFYLSHRAK